MDNNAVHLVERATILVGEPEIAGDRLFWHEVPLNYEEQGFVGIIEGAGQPEALFYLFKLQLTNGGCAYYVPREDGRSTAGTLAFPDFDGKFTDAGWTISAQNARPTKAEDFVPINHQPGFQITYYDPDFETPSWMEGSVMYQIFPDRFARGSAGVRQVGIDAHREMQRPVHLHEEWEEPVVWRGGQEYDPVDFFGGSFDGIREKLPYLASLGVQIIYLNPVFEARSNHRYDTASYEHVDPLLGTDEDFKKLVDEAARMGIRIVLDAVLSHTGADSVYFNALETYEQPGAAQGWDSPYRDWYDFDHPNGRMALYRCWWGDPTLPEVDERNPSWQRYIFGSVPNEPNPNEGILPHWLAQGVSGYRLDVADEIPDDILERIRETVKRAEPDAAVIGEVWEDATNKVSYGAWRTYALGRSLDSVMNYPLRIALLGFAIGIVDAHQLATFLKIQKSNYPAPLYRSLMNLMSSHDVERQRTILALGSPIKQLPREQQARMLVGITREEDERGARLQRLLAGILYALPGMPCLYYGDERGLQGGGDPFCRSTFPWDETPRADRGVDLVSFYQELGQLRFATAPLRRGDMRCYANNEDALCILRELPEDGQALLAASNRSDEPVGVSFDMLDLGYSDAHAWTFHPVWHSEGGPLDFEAQNEGGIVHLTIPPLCTVYLLSL